MTPLTDALTADRRVHAGPSQVDTTPIPLPHGAVATFRPPSPDNDRLAVHFRSMGGIGADSGYIAILDRPAAAALLGRLLAYVTPAQPGGMAAPTAHPWFDVLQEHRRQIHVEGFVPEHDDHHTMGELAAAAGSYALVGVLTAEERAARGGCRQPPQSWPFDAEWWTPTTPRQDLVRAGALILAELARLDRAAQRGA